MACTPNSMMWHHRMICSRKYSNSERWRMTDNVSPARRSQLMAGIRGQNTRPEMVVRRIAHRMGLRFRLYRKDIPSRPDLVFPKHRVAVLVHGCFWHQHDGCRYAHIPKSRVRYWTEKFSQNVARDRRNEEALRDVGWRVVVIWECETGDKQLVERKLASSVRHNESGLTWENNSL